MNVMLRHSFVYKICDAIYSFFGYIRKEYEAPAPRFIKNKVLLRNCLKNAIWIETGTFYGQTTSFLSLSAKHVYTLEPSNYIYSRVSKFLKKRYSNVDVYNFSSEDGFETILKTVSGDVNFWLDGHYSMGDTYEGKLHTPISYELSMISNYLPKLSRICICIDDIRLFGCDSNISGYPSLNALVDWASDNGFKWTIEHDIFIAKNY